MSMNITSSGTLPLKLNFKTVDINIPKTTTHTQERKERNTDFYLDPMRFRREVKPNLPLDKILTSSVYPRTRRSPSEQSDTAHPRASQSEGESTLNVHPSLTRLDQFPQVFPTCTNAIEGQPNPSVPEGYASWEAFFASDGINTEIKNPQQELTAKLVSTANYFTFDRVRSMYRVYNDFRAKFSSSLEPLTQERARSEFASIQSQINNVFEKTLSEWLILRKKLIQKMKNELQNISHNTSNRWIKGGCWASTTQADRWNASWQSRLPQALTALDAVSEDLRIPMSSTLRGARQGILENVENFYNEYANARGWETMEVSIENTP